MIKTDISAPTMIAWTEPFSVKPRACGAPLRGFRA
jgi:hypothetical protein